MTAQDLVQAALVLARPELARHKAGLRIIDIPQRGLWASWRSPDREHCPGILVGPDVIQVLDPGPVQHLCRTEDLIQDVALALDVAPATST